LVIGLSIIGASITTYLPPHHGFIACPSSQVDNHWPFWNFASCFESSRERDKEREREREREECPFFITLCPITTFFSLQKSGIYYGTF
jgi:hypothetical protein